MARAKKTWKLVLTSVILSILILAAFTAVFIRLIVPAYNITREQIYSVLTKALPILIGLVFIEIALVSSRRSENDYRENIDKLAPNAYDSPLYTKPVDDPLTKRSPSGNEFNVSKTEPVVREIIKEVPVEVVREVVKEVPVEVVREVPVEVEVVKEVPVEVVREVEKEVPVEVVKEVPVEVVKEVEKPVEVIREVPVEIIKEVVREVPVEVVKEVEKPVEVEVIKEVVREVPVEIIKEVEKPVEVIKEVVKEVPVEVIKEVEKPVEVIKEVPVEVVKEIEKPVEVVKNDEAEKEADTEEDEVYLSFSEALAEEIEEAKNCGYPLVLVKGDDEAKIEEAFDAPSFVEDGKAYAILPYTRRKDVLKKAKLAGASVLEMDSSSTAEGMLKAINR